MKTIIIILLLSFSIKGFGQEKDIKKRTYVIEYDFQTGKFPDGDKIKPRVDVPVVFIVKNINRLAYTVKIVSKDSVVGFSDLSDLKKLITDNEVKKIAENLEKAETIPTLQTNNLPINKNDFLKEDAKNNNEDIVKQFEKLVNDINNTNTNLLEKLNSKINNIIKKDTKGSINESMDTILLPALSKSLNEKFTYHFNTQTDLTNLYLKIIENHKTINSLYNDYLQIRTILNNPLLNETNLQDYEEELKSCYKRFNENKNILNEINLYLNRFQNLYVSLKSNPEITQQTNFGGSIKLFSIADNLNIEIQSIKEQIAIIKFEKFKQEIDQIYTLLIVNIDKTSLFEYVSNPIQPSQDVAVFKVKIDKNNKDASLFYNERDFSYKAFTRHGIRFDLNLGVAGSFHKKNNTYEIKADSLGVNRITNTNSSGFSPSFVGFFTTSYRSATHFTYGLSIGLGISADNGKIASDNFFIGPSLVIGRYERINLTTGISFKNLPKLNSNYKEKDTVSNTTIIESITSKSYQSGFFIALTYNFTKGVKNNVNQINNFL